MRPRQITLADLAYWGDATGLAEQVTYAADDPTFAPCPAIHTADAGTEVGGGLVVRVPWQLDEIELAHLARGGTLWLSTWGGLPPHMLEVQEPARGA